LNAERKDGFSETVSALALMSLWPFECRAEGTPVETCTILTTEANEQLRALHNRMPLILDSTADASWLDPGTNAASLHALLVPYPGDRMEASPVDPWVSDPKHEGPRCLEPVEA
jgi:putative SOS response-associated peptidase YedK